MNGSADISEVIQQRGKSNHPHGGMCQVWRLPVARSIRSMGPHFGGKNVAIEDCSPTHPIFILTAPDV